MPSKSLFSKEIDPFRQAIYIFLVCIFFTLFSKVLDSLSIMPYEDHTPWSMSAAGLMLFAIFNSVLSLSYKNQNKYWLRSALAFTGLLLSGGVFAYFMSGLSISEAKSFKWIYVLFTIGYLSFLSIVRMMRKIVQIAQKQDRILRGED